MSGGLEPRANVGVEAAEKPGVPGCTGFSESPSVLSAGAQVLFQEGGEARVGRGGGGDGLEVLTRIHSSCLLLLYPLM